MRLDLVSIALVVLALSGCAASYVTPGGPVDIPTITDVDIAEVLATEPGASFPAQLIVARIQGSGYTSYTNRGYGRGSYSVLIARDVETDSDLERIAGMPGVAAVGQLSRILLPAELSSAHDLREAAARLRGDVLLLYTFDTSFRTDTLRIGPLQAISMGFFPNKKAHVTTTCALAFVDVRTGYVYGVAEASSTQEQRGNAWNTSQAIDEARVLAESAAFAGALTEAEQVWNAILAQHAGA